MSLTIRRIDCAAENAIELIEGLRRQLSPDGDVVTERGRELTRKVFGEELPPGRSVERICREVRLKGFSAVRQFSKAFDDFELTRENLRVAARDLAAAHRQADPAFLDTVRRIRRNILSFQSGIVHRDAVLRDGDQFEVGLRYRPVRRVGVCIPGGAAAYPSTLLMTVCPAQAAGVQEICVIAPPTPFGSNNADVLAVCHELGIGEVYRLGGAQGVAALAYGIDGLPRVDMIVGPGNLFVTLAKRQVFGQVGIDMLAGPTELVVIADDSAQPHYIASDLISQAEHAPGASILITWDAELPNAVIRAAEKQLGKLPRGAQARESLERFGAILTVRHAAQAAELANAIAPEHLHLCTRQPDHLAEEISNAGAIFLGSLTPVALGDYFAGPSHVLPTGGTARFSSGLSANDFLRRTSLVKFSRAGLEAAADDVRRMAEKEGLTGHSYSVDVRLEAVAAPRPQPAHP
jgi:histidinol dehydrogenase